MSITLDSIVLPEDLIWIDEYQWSGVQQQTDIMADGAVVVQADAQQTGRPITLRGGDNFGWIDKATLESLRTMARTAQAEYTLTLHDAVERNVVFTGDRLQAEQVVERSDSDDTDFYIATLYLMEL